MSWTDQRTEDLKKLWGDGKSASQIAKALGGVSRNAVIGKVHRLGLSGRASASKPTRAARAPAPPRPRPQSQVFGATKVPLLQQPVGLPPKPFASAPDVAGPKACSLLELEPGMCKWPIGDPASDGLRFCGEATERPTPDKAADNYCDAHKRRAMAPTAAKTNRANPSELARSLRRFI